MAALEAVQYAVEDRVDAENAADEAAYRVWWALWQQLGLRVPAAFGPRGTQLERCSAQDLCFCTP